MQSQYDNYQNIILTVELLKKNNIKHIVISPGGTNIALVKLLQDDSFFKCYSVIDERSAMYFAIGLYLQTGEIIATSCTSAQATRNYIPGLTEAFYKKVPILAITMEKHSRFKYQEYMQAPDQTSLPNDCVKKSFELPYISDKNDYLYSLRLINEAILEITNGSKGPVQLCIPWIDYPLANKNPQIRQIIREKDYMQWGNLRLENKKILIAIGEHIPFSEKEKNAIENFCESHDAVVYTTHLSNYHGKYSVNGNLILSTIGFEKFSTTLAPDVLITIGGIMADYSFYVLFSNLELTKTEHWRIDEDGRVVDTYDKLTKIYQCSPLVFFENASTSENVVHNYFTSWNQELESRNYSIDVPFSNLYAAQHLHHLIPENSYVNFAILNSLRVWSFFELSPTIKCFSNVAAFGIDGCMSTLLGESMETDSLCFLIIGDLSFCYDMNSLAIRHIKNNVRILLINNSGGVEFKLNGINNKSTDRFIAAGGHFKDARGWAITCGFKYLKATNKEEFNKNINEFICESNSPILYEIFVSDKDDSEAYREFRDKNSDLTTTEKTKRLVKNLIRSTLK